MPRHKGARTIPRVSSRRHQPHRPARPHSFFDARHRVAAEAIRGRGHARLVRRLCALAAAARTTAAGAKPPCCEIAMATSVDLRQTCTRTTSDRPLRKLPYASRTATRKRNYVANLPQQAHLRNERWAAGGPAHVDHVVGIWRPEMTLSDGDEGCVQPDALWIGAQDDLGARRQPSPPQKYVPSREGTHPPDQCSLQTAATSVMPTREDDGLQRHPR